MTQLTIGAISLTQSSTGVAESTRLRTRPVTGNAKPSLEPNTNPDTLLARKFLKRGLHSLTDSKYAAKLNPTFALILTLLATNAASYNDDKFNWTGTRYLAERCFVTQIRIRQVLPKLLEWELIKMRPSAIFGGNEYLLNAPVVAPLLYEDVDDVIEAKAADAGAR